MREETQKLLIVGHIREIQYPEWLENVVMVKNESGKWRICINFTDLNKACPKDPYPLPNIDSLVDNASDCDLLSFLDAFSGYNQIWIHPKDENKTAFMAEASSYCYKVMPFRLKHRNRVCINSEALKRRVELKYKTKNKPSTIQGSRHGTTKSLPSSNRE